MRNTTPQETKSNYDLVFEMDNKESDVMIIKGQYPDGTFTERTMRVLTFTEKELESIIEIGKSIRIEDTPYARARRCLKSIEDKSIEEDKTKRKGIFDLLNRL